MCSLSGMEQKANIYAVSPPGTGKTAALILSMLNNINPSVNKVQSLMICVNFEAALQAYRFATCIVKAAGININLCFTRSDQSPTFDGICHAIVGCSLSDIPELEMGHIHEVYLDDGDIKATGKMALFLNKLRPSTRIVLASSTSNSGSVTLMKQLGPLDQLKLPDNKWFNSNIKHCFIISDNVKEKRYILGETLRLFKEKGLGGQGLVFCTVCIHTIYSLTIFLYIFHH